MTRYERFCKFLAGLPLWIQIPLAIIWAPVMLVFGAFVACVVYPVFFIVAWAGGLLFIRDGKERRKRMPYTFSDY